MQRRRGVWSLMKRGVVFVFRVLQRYRTAGIGRVAAGLSFTTLLGIVPLFTVALTYVARFPVFDQWLDTLQPFLVKFLLPDSSSAVRHYLAEFTTKAAGVQGVGTVFLIVTAVLLVAQTEREINAIWGIHEARSLPRRIVVYALGFVAVPALIGAAVRITSWAIEQSIAAVPGASEALSLLVQPIEIAIATLALTMMYKLVPARHVPIRHALIGALLAAVAFELAKLGFKVYITRVPTYRVVYGALATLPLFLIWIYVSWIVLLLGAAVTATLTERGGKARSRRRRS
jgi:membrane protein